MKLFFQLLLFATLLFMKTLCSEDEGEATPEERDPWDKSTDRNHHGNSDENLRVDVTESSESEVHTAKSEVAKQKMRGEVEKIDKQYDRLLQTKKKNDLKARKKKAHKKRKKKNPKIVKIISPGTELRSQPKVDVETKQQFEDAADEKDSIDEMNQSDELLSFAPQLEKAEFNYGGEYYPGSLWQYPYPYFHPQYSCNQPMECACATEGGAESKNKGDSAPNVVPLRKVKSKTKTKKQRKQLIPTHYYGPPSAGWGGFQPGKTGCGWGVPYWYKKGRVPLARQLIPTHYYGPPSAGWGGFQPGKTGCGWGVPYWYKKRHDIHRHGNHHHHNSHLHHERQLIPTHYYGPPSAGWGGFQPGKTGCGWGVPYWYKSEIPNKVHKPTVERAQRKFIVIGHQPFAFGHNGQISSERSYGRGFGQTTQGDPNVWGFGPSSWSKGGIDYKAWFGPKGFGSQGWGGKGWVGGDYGMTPTTQSVGVSGKEAGFDNSGSDTGRIDQPIVQGDFASTTKFSPNIQDGSPDENTSNQEGTESKVPTEAKQFEENKAEMGIGKSTRHSDIPFEEDGINESATSDILQVNSADEVKSTDDLVNQFSDYTDNKGDLDQSIAEVSKDANGVTKVTNIDEQLPENVEVSNSESSSSNFEYGASSPSNSRTTENESSDSSSVSSNKTSSNTTSVQNVKHELNEKENLTKTAPETGGLATIALNKNKNKEKVESKIGSQTAQEELKEKVDQLIKESNAAEKIQKVTEKKEKNTKEQESLLKQEEAYGTIKSKPAMAAEKSKEKAKIKTEQFASKREPVHLKTVKTEAANEKPLTL